jgi:hypothetical protein
MFHTRSNPIAGTEVAFSESVLAQIDNTQEGATAVWTYKLTPLYTLATSAFWARTDANDASGQRSREASVQAVLSAPLSLLSTVFAGARYQRITGNIDGVVREAALFVGVTHVFR